MQRRLGTLLLSTAVFGFVAYPEKDVSAAELPPVKLTDSNTVPECVTPGRLMSYVRSRNEKLDPKYDTVAVEYMRQGEELGIRWDYAFYQMMLETNTLKYTGDVKMDQNNFAGLGATGGGVRGESFKSVSDGVRAHLQHLLMYAGDRVENPVAERTKNIQEWGVLTKWQATIKGPMTYTQLAKKWAPTSRGYPRDVETLANLFVNGACKADDPNPEMVQEARGGRAIETNGKVASAGKGAELAKQAIAQARTEGAPKVGLGAENIAKTTHDATNGSVANGPPIKLLNAAPVVETAAAPAEEVATVQPVKASVIAPAASAAKADSKPDAKADAKADSKADNKSKPAASKTESKTEVAALTTPLLGDAKPPQNADAKCRVFTASYGGSKSIIIKAIAEGVSNYTVLDVNDGAEKREADAYIAAYAKGGETVGDPQTQDKALEKAFELCPEG